PSRLIGVLEGVAGRNFFEEFSPSIFFAWSWRKRPAFCHNSTDIIIKYQHKQEYQEQNTYLRRYFTDLTCDGPADNSLDNKKHQMATIQNWDRKNINNGKINADIAHQKKEAEHARFEAFAGCLHYGYRTSERFRAHLSGYELYQRLYHEFGQERAESQAF